MFIFPEKHSQNSQNANLTSIESKNLINEVTLCRWKVSPNSVKYQRETSHTLSLYHRGGCKTYRTDKPSNKGSPGKLCVMPQGQESHWHVNEELELTHLYITDKFLKQFAARHFDVDARVVDLHDLVYQQDDILQQLINYYATTGEFYQKTQPMFSEQNLNLILSRILTRYSGIGEQLKSIRGGLSSQHRRQLINYIYDNLSEKLTINLLAKQVGLSPFHFAHMFKKSMCDSPANFILSSRIEKSKALLGGKESIHDISILTGFNQQSHFTAYFKSWLVKHRQHIERH